ncbi:MAG TPA: ArdC-like ssDNA-binding domain-containing protein [Chitinophagaceae bacterium]|nr:ArdC-like ssDNA-binding domain-containing protein [Chitinophagaceae bacterium]
MTDEMKEKREGLKIISRMIQQLVKEGVYTSVNEGLADMYRQQGHTEIASFKKWIEKGYCVKKGEKALLMWGQPRNADNKKKDKEGDADEFSFFPLAYLFSNKQVEPLKHLAR